MFYLIVDIVRPVYIRTYSVVDRGLLKRNFSTKDTTIESDDSDESGSEKGSDDVSIQL